jgi:hypothetical protein
VLMSPSSATAPFPLAEGDPPQSERWTEERLFSPTLGRHDALQSALDAWHDGRWILTETELGRGSAGVVIRCSDRRLGSVAIKFSRVKEPKKLEREAALMQRVAHAHVCKLYEHGEIGGGLCGLVMEHLSMGALSDLAKADPRRRISEGHVTQMASQILSALSFIHGRDVIHRERRRDLARP